MAQRAEEERRGSPKGKRPSGELKELSIFEQIRELAHRDARTFSGEKHNIIFLMSWWSDKYNRPLKDPILQSYTLEELAYEYYLSVEHIAAQKERDEAENDKIEEAKEREAQAWADQMEAEEEEDVVPEYVNPLDDPKNQQWIKEEMDRDREEYGEDFGSDFDIDF